MGFTTIRILAPRPDRCATGGKCSRQNCSSRKVRWTATVIWNPYGKQNNVSFICDDCARKWCERNRMPFPPPQEPDDQGQEAAE